MNWQPGESVLRRSLPHPKSLSDSERDFNTVVVAPLSNAEKGEGSDSVR